ncbi:type II toxin-antitoxin system RelB/DinJ family antitoxin [Pseudoflavonifractor phocaeensis]|uniref:type II toxin-antitoxin system RelB/DinJ family antitoxin n=1 Tax=Pseudoflavonifractor phocaeensis TaxID=1870988 RepID=UPI00195805CD|nr:type II toxin-antitoxin system RelB/DinJ family antitoxin [Pseudoflavonifractor phocaeensis]
MDANMTFRMDSDIKAQMAAICDQIGMTTSTAFNIFAKAFVRAKGMPFPVTLQEQASPITRTQMLSDADRLLTDFSEDYRRMAE